MTPSTALDLGRVAVADRRWADAYERLAAVDSTEGLAAPDLELYATTAFLRGEGAVAADALARAHAGYASADDLVGATRTAAWIALVLLDLGDVFRSRSWAQRGIRLADAFPEPSALSGLVRIVPALSELMIGDAIEAVRRFEHMSAIAHRSRDRELSAIASFGSGLSLVAVGASRDGLAAFDEALLAVPTGDLSPIIAGIISCATIGTARMAFDLERATRWISDFEQWCRRQPDLVAFTGWCQAHRSALLLLHGAWKEALAAAEFAEARYQAGDHGAAWAAAYQLAELERMRGEFRAAEQHYRRAGKTHWDPQPGLALLHLAEGRPQLAQSEIRRSQAGEDEGTRRHLLPATVDIEVGNGDLHAARRAAEELGVLSRSSPTPMLAAVAAFAEGRVLLAEGEPARASSRLRAATSAWRELGAPYEAARCRVLMGRALRELGDDDSAAVEFDAAHEVFLELGAVPALAELADVVGDRRQGRLTVRELEVLRLVSTGLTNRGIAARLALSEKTVARHLSNIFGKLGLSTRAAATAYAYEHGLV